MAIQVGYPSTALRVVGLVVLKPLPVRSGERVALRRQRSDGVGSVGVGRDDHGVAGAPQRVERQQSPTGRHRAVVGGPRRVVDTSPVPSNMAQHNGDYLHARGPGRSHDFGSDAQLAETEPQLHGQSWPVLFVGVSSAVRGRQRRRVACCARWLTVQVRNPDGSRRAWLGLGIAGQCRRLR